MPEAFLGTWSPELIAALDIAEEDHERGLALLETLALTGDQAAIESYSAWLSMEAPASEAAVEWSLKAAEFHSTTAIWNLAMIAHERGNQGEMAIWIDRAAALGLEDAVQIKRLDYDVEAFLQILRDEDESA